MRLRAPLRRVIRLSRRPTRHCCPRRSFVYWDLSGLPVLATLERAASLRPTKHPCRILSVGPMVWKRRAATRESTTRSFGEASAVERGGDPKTDLSLHSNACVDADSPQSGGLATQTATPDSPACTVLAVSSILAHDSELRDEFPSILQDPDHRDEFPSIAEGSESRDGLPRSGDIVMNSSSDNTDTVFSRVFHDDEKSEGVRQSDFRVQNLPASGSPSELSAHQMGGALAGKTRLTTEAIDTGRLDRSYNIGYADNLTSLNGGIRVSVLIFWMETGQLSIADRALMRKYKSLETVRENSQQAGTYKREITSSVSRVDGHPLKPSLSLYDRTLLRKYPDANFIVVILRDETFAFVCVYFGFFSSCCLPY